jgi:tetratricopeptide (TPR) repeat protein
VSHLWGPTPIPELLAWLDEQEERAGASHAFRTTRAHALAMLGHVDEARGMLAEVYAELAARGGGIQLGGIEGQTFVDVELLAGDPAAAAEHGERGCAILEELGERGLLSTAVAKLAQAYYALGRLDDAEAAAARAAELGGTDDAITQMLSRQVRAKVLANRGEHAEAERLAREAVSTGEQTDLLNSQAEAHADLGEALSLAGRREAATQALEQALRRYERKGNLVLAERIRERLATTAARR